MPRVDCVVSSPVGDSFRVQQLLGMFDIPPATNSVEKFSVDIPGEDEEWSIGAIVGPSGSGKSTVARKAFGERLYAEKDWPFARSVIEAFDDGLSIKDITAMLTSVGFSSPPGWLKPYAVLSNGEKFRCNLAKALLGGSQLVAYDEFTSVVDRRIGQIGSAAVSKAVRRMPGRKFVAVTCHYDVIDWLEPDWVLDMASGQLARGRLWQRPPIKIRIYQSSHRYWPLFAKHHYLNAKKIPGSVCYVGEIDGQPACFVAVRTSMGHVGCRRISRILVLPDYQGVGVGMACLNAVADLTAAQTGIRKVTIISGHPAMIRAIDRHPSWICREFRKSGGSKNGRLKGIATATGRCVAQFEYRPKVPAAN